MECEAFNVERLGMCKRSLDERGECPDQLDHGDEFSVQVRRRRRLMGPSAEAVRDMQVARATVRPRSECHHCNPGIDGGSGDGQPHPDEQTRTGQGA